MTVREEVLLLLKSINEPISTRKVRAILVHLDSGKVRGALVTMGREGILTTSRGNWGKSHLYKYKQVYPQEN